MRQFLRFVLVGIFNTGLGYLIIFSCMYLLGMSAELSNATGYGAGLVCSYVLNRHFTFASQQRRSTEIPRFLLVFAISYAINFLTLLVLLHWFGVHAGWSQVVAGVMYVAASYLLNKFYVFKKNEKI